ncbi:MAG: hypothetical protein ACYDCL_05625 [Myxococcales bacterium]
MPADEELLHDLKNLIGAILSRTKLLEREVPPEASKAWVAQQAEGLRRTAVQMLELVERLGSGG